MKKFFNKRNNKGFTLIELLVVVANIGIISSVILVGINSARRTVNVHLTGMQQRELSKAIELYYDDMGFYPPDVNRGWDPGFVQSMPWNPDAGTSDPPVGSFATAGTDCSHCPYGWQTIISNKWKGPYLPVWPNKTAWKGKYDYNYWNTSRDRSGCTVPAGIYIGVLGDYQNNNTIPQNAEEKMIERGFDFEKCLNGESQLLLVSLQNN